MQLDAHTLKDLEVFASDADSISLFQLCNHCRTEGGAERLKRRMEQPWSDPIDISATQTAVSFILSGRSLFRKVPSSYACSRVDHYAHEVLPIVVHTNRVEFAIGALSLWANHSRHYLGIIRGVHVACGFIRTLRQFVAQPALTHVAGELVALLDEMQTLLARPGYHAVPDHEVGAFFLKILRLDQVFRFEEKESMARLLQLTYEIDALVSMADATETHGFVMPELLNGPLRVTATELVHPFLTDPATNPVELNQEKRVLFLTGPNMAGKTTYLRAFATAYYFAHLGMGVPAKQFAFVPADQLFSSISLSDDIHGGISYFRAEALRVKAIAEAVASGDKVVAIMDEPFKGTNVKDALDASQAILERFAVKQGCLFMFSSHLIELGEQVGVDTHIDCRFFEAEEGGGRLRFDYQLRSGISDQRLGMRVLEEEGVFDLLDVSQNVAVP